LNKWKGFQWTEECDGAFRDLKSYLASPLVLSRLEAEEDLSYIWQFLTMS